MSDSAWYGYSPSASDHGAVHGGRRARHHRGMRCKSKRATAGGNKIGGRSSRRRQPLLTPALSSPGRRGRAEGAATLSLRPVAAEVTLALSTTFPLRLWEEHRGRWASLRPSPAPCDPLILPVQLDPDESHLSQLIPLHPGKSRESHLVPLNPGGTRQEEEKSCLKRPRGGGRACIERRSAAVGTIVEGGRCPSHGIPLVPLSLTQSRESHLVPANPTCPG